MESLRKTYTERAAKFSSTATELSKKYDQLSWARLFLFLVGIAVLVLLFSNSPLVGGVVVLIFIVGFARFVLWHQGILRERDFNKALAAMNEKELKILDGNINEFDNGEEFLDPLHSYLVDLDIFGAYSFFQYSNRTATLIGKKRWAKYLSDSVDYETIINRQDAAQELATYLAWRQEFQAIGRNTKETERDVDMLIRWLDEPPFLLNRSYMLLVLWGLPLLTFALIFSVFFIPYQIAVGMMIFNLFLIQQAIKYTNKAHQYTSEAGDILGHYAKLIDHIEQRTFTTPKLQALQQQLKTDEKNAVKYLKQLSLIIHQFNARLNIFSIFLQMTILWDLQWLYRLEKWKANLKDRLPIWFEVLQEFDAMVSLGTLYYNHTDWKLPNIHPNAQHFEGEAIGHPMLPRENRVDNNLTVPSKGHIKLITGSNMAGKSTFLRSVGMNIVLAMIGAPVCAARLELPLLQVHTSMRTQDALHESTSSFYAELKRLKTIIDAVEAGQPVFFLLDEILKGTNSTDRHTGSKALIRQLIDSKGMGLIATHDLDLGTLEAQYGGTIENLCLEVEVENDQLVFDYTVKKGVSKSFNATYLMRSMGIRV